MLGLSNTVRTRARAAVLDTTPVKLGTDGLPAGCAPQHEVWKLTSGEPIQACVFQSVRHDAVDGPP
jgi:hypothetical protein